MDVKYNTDTKIEDNSRAFKLQKANFDKEVNTAVSIQLRSQRLWSFPEQKNLCWIPSFVQNGNSFVHILPWWIFGVPFRTENPISYIVKVNPNFFRSTESRGAVGVRAAGCQNPAEDQERGDSNSGACEKLRWSISRTFITAKSFLIKPWVRFAVQTWSEMLFVIGFIAFTWGYVPTFPGVISPPYWLRRSLRIPQPSARTYLNFCASFTKGNSFA